MHHYIPAAGAVDARGFYQIGRNVGKVGEVNNRAPADALPHARPHIQVIEIFRLVHEGNGFPAQGDNRVVHNPTVHIEEHVNHCAHNHRGNEVRHIADHLHRFFELMVRKLVDHQRKDDGAGERREGI